MFLSPAHLPQQQTTPPPCKKLVRLEDEVLKVRGGLALLDELVLGHAQHLGHDAHGIPHVDGLDDAAAGNGDEGVSVEGEGLAVAEGACDGPREVVLAGSLVLDGRDLEVGAGELGLHGKEILDGGILAGGDLGLGDVLASLGILVTDEVCDEREVAVKKVNGGLGDVGRLGVGDSRRGRHGPGTLEHVELADKVMALILEPAHLVLHIVNPLLLPLPALPVGLALLLAADLLLLLLGEFAVGEGGGVPGGVRRGVGRNRGGRGRRAGRIGGVRDEHGWRAGKVVPRVLLRLREGGRGGVSSGELIKLEGGGGGHVTTLV
mmetsp:Transcript_2292/g.4251  ORF Transcript_2292/g.4251 Transcript_2292/m.4251 type:complete len:320 (+) Transcript_2292:483-1442(+)